MKYTGLQAFFLALLLFFGSKSFAQTDGYLSNYSVSQGEKLKFYISTPDSVFDLKIYKLGLYKKAMLTLPNLHGVIQHTGDSAFIQGCNWKITSTLTIPLTWQSGIYEADIPAGDSVKKLIFIVKEKYLGMHSKTLVCLTVNTWQAYNNWGGRSLYDFNSYSQTASKKISFNRPLSDTAANYYFRWADKLVNWLEAHHFDAEFCTNTDLDADPLLLSHYKTYVTVGHDEYWSRPERNSVESFLHSAGRIICLSGNTCWWQVRFEDSLRTMVCYRDTTIDPMYPFHDSIVTSIWARSPINQPPNTFLGVSFEHGGFINDDGIFPQYLGYGGYTVFNSNHWIYNGTGVKDGDVIGQDDAIAGYESDGALYTWDRGFPMAIGEDQTPTNFSILGISTAASTANLSYGHATMGYFSIPNGGAVFNGGSTDWVRGLDRDDSIQSQMLFNIFWRFTSGFDLPPEISSFSPVRLTLDSINHEWVNVNHESMKLSPNTIDTFIIHARSPKGKGLLFYWEAAGKKVGSDSVLILTPEMKKKLPNAFIFEGSATADFENAKVSWQLLDTTLRFVSLPAASCKRRSNYFYQTIAASLVDEHVQYSMIYGPSWLHLDSKGFLSGISGDVPGEETVILRAADSKGNYDFQTFNIMTTDSVQSSVAILPAKGLRCYPNPVYTILTLELEASQRNIESRPIRIIDLLGREVYNSEFSSRSLTVHIPTASLSEGVYYVQVGNLIEPFVKTR